MGSGIFSEPIFFSVGLSARYLARGCVAISISRFFDLHNATIRLKISSARPLERTNFR